MGIYHEKALELANEILASEESKNFADAAAEFERNPEDETVRAELIRFKNDYEVLIGSVMGVMHMALGVSPVSSGCGGGGCGGCGGGCCKEDD
ncbi:MAG: hypothetical protein FWB74_06225 [Defluviitaleaceae bacterium]|nr:hypothetical protein [Defluviitaleaceae bacterium]